MLLSRGRPYLRKTILGRGSSEEVSEGLLGNTILLAQPTTGQIQQQMPPPRDAFCDGLSVIFTTSRDEVAKAKPLQVSRSEYLECARIRQKVCYGFADVSVSESAAQELLPEHGVPPAFLQEAVQLQEAKFFEPKMDGPASIRDPGSKEEDAGSAEEDSDSETKPDEEAAAVECQDAASHAEEEMHEQLIGLDEANLDDPLSQVTVLQSRLRALKDEGDKLVQRQLRNAQNAEKNMEDIEQMVKTLISLSLRFTHVRSRDEEAVDGKRCHRANGENTNKSTPTIYACMMKE